MKKRVLIISQTAIFSGAEIVLYDYIRTQNEHDLFIYTNSNKDICENYQKLVPEGRQFYSKYMTAIFLRKQPCLIYLWLYYLIVNIYCIHKIVKRYNIDVLYGNNSPDINLISLYKKILNPKIKAIVHIHDMLQPTQIPAIFLKSFCSVIDKIIVPSNATHHCITHLLKQTSFQCENIHVAYNGVQSMESKNENLTAFSQKSGKKVIAFIGTINQRKRPDLFVDIIAALTGFSIEFKALILGKVIDRSLKKNIERKIKVNQLPISFYNAISREDMDQFYNKIDILVLTSDRDPLPTVALEAMAKGKLVFSRAVDGICEIIENHRNGFTFDYETNDMKKIAEQLFKILSTDEEELNVIRKNAIQTIRQRFSLEQKNKVINQIIGSL